MRSIDRPGAADKKECYNLFKKCILTLYIVYLQGDTIETTKQATRSSAEARKEREGGRGRTCRPKPRVQVPCWTTVQVIKALKSGKGGTDTMKNTCVGEIPELKSAQKHHRQRG